MKSNIFLTLLCILITTKSYANEDINKEFIEALKLADKGNLFSAEFRLEMLLLKERTPRILLELARLEFLQNKLDESEKHFKEVKALPNIPIPVLNNIEIYLNRIKRLKGYFDYSLSLTSEDNPLNFTDETIVRIGLFDFEINPPTKEDNFYGVEHNIEFSTTQRHKYFINGFISYADFNGSIVDRLSGLLNFNIKQPIKFSDLLILSNERYQRNGKEIYQLNSYELISSPIYKSKSSNVRLGIKLGDLDFNNTNYNDADLYQLRFILDEVNTKLGRLTTSINLSDMQSVERPYSNIGQGINLGLNGYTFSKKLGYSIKASFSDKKYKATNPIFSKRRNDERYSFEVSILPNWLRVFSRRVSLNLNWDKNHSSIGYFSYDNFGLGVSIN